MEKPLGLENLQQIAKNNHAHRGDQLKEEDGSYHVKQLAKTEAQAYIRMTRRWVGHTHAGSLRLPTDLGAFSGPGEKKGKLLCVPVLARKITNLLGENGAVCCHMYKRCDAFTKRAESQGKREIACDWLNQNRRRKGEGQDPLRPLAKGRHLKLRWSKGTKGKKEETSQCILTDH